MRYGIFSCSGLGDGLISLILSENLRKEGHEVVTFHPFMSQLQPWFPYLPLRPFPQHVEELESFERWVVFYEKSAWMQTVLNYCLAHHRPQTTVLNPIATPHTDYPFWEEGRFDGRRPLADNLVTFCRVQWGLSKAEKKNGLTLPPDVQRGVHARRVIVHPTSSRPGKNWPRAKFLKLTGHLQRRGFEPLLLVSPQEKSGWPEAPFFPDLDAMFRCVAESALFVGNDSGIGHLASCMGIPTLSLFKNSRSADFWRPAFALNLALTPQGWLPNLKGLRWRDHYWHWGISVRRVVRAFDELCILRHERLTCAFP